ncbi:MAG: DUF1549 domain-containing protein [Gemmataceae bacterium]|nr:DUF1549 domain-containing protein [Gemmataceae bacterium]
MQLRWWARTAVVVGVIATLAWLWLRTPDSDAPPIVLQSQPTATRTVQFRRDVLPILSSKCYSCHGPDSSSRKGGLRLDQREFALASWRSGETAIVPGKPADSEVVRRIHSGDAKAIMPPTKTGKSLTAKEKQMLEKWIAEGAEYQQHWAFESAVRPAVPTVKNMTWVRNPIDAFVLARLEAAGIEPSPRADRVTLIRRLSIDLRGLPPTMGEVDAFLADESPEAWDKLIDRMLASPHYGEKMTQVWLDLARFGDTSGYHNDSTRQMWLWRDWVINAFNTNMRYDQFTIEQLAGDLLPNATVQQKIATGFNRNTRFNEEGGVDPEEYVVRYTVDRVNTLGQIWLGLTLNCAECHDHKFDPISQKEYYQLFAFFSGIKEPMVEGAAIHGKPLPPILSLPSSEQTKKLVDCRNEQAMIEKAIVKELDRFKYVDPNDKNPKRSQSAWEASVRDSLDTPADIRTIVNMAEPQRDDKRKRVLRDYYLRHVHEDASEVIGPLDRHLDELAKQIKDTEDAIPHGMVTEQMVNPRPAFVLKRGDFASKGERVAPGVPIVFAGTKDTASSSRLDLARWLMRADHPLTGRVTANRLWTQMFGTGLVRTFGDFGTQGEPPTHPELFDWLASELATSDSPWDLKRMLRLIASSATYKQASIYRADVAKIDPQNRLVSRMGRHRQSAEELRDSALAIAGLLQRKVGGPSFQPYQPPDFYKFKNEDWSWNPSEGAEQYRRGIYAFWRRTALHPMFTILDAPSRQECIVVRDRSNTPLQAFVLLNDPTFVESARVLAEKLLQQNLAHDDRLKLLFRMATCRVPDATEVDILRERWKLLHERFRKDPDGAGRFVSVGQYPRDISIDVVALASWTALANMVLNLDEVIMRE